MGCPARQLDCLEVKKRMDRIYIVAEIGCNHNGDKGIAKKMIQAAKECGVDAVKFQTFHSGALISRYAPKAEYQKRTTGNKDSQLEMTRKLELPEKDYLELKEYAMGLGLDVFSTPFDLEAVDFLHRTGQEVWKIPSGEVTNLPYLEKIGGLNCGDGKEVIVSTGMATMEEIETCIDLLIKAGTSKGRLLLLHCNTEYPTPDGDVNLSAIQALRQAFPGIRVGFSDHSAGYVAAVGAAVLGAVMIEKHFTLDKNMEGPDHKASVTPDELLALCENVRRVELMLGNGKKFVTESEKKNKVVARKSIVAAEKILEGEVFTEANLTCKRPGNGISPMAWYELLGKKAGRDFEVDELIEDSAFVWQGE